MKKKKPPVLLFSVLALAILGLVIGSAKWKFWTLSAEDQHKELQEQAMAQARANAPKQAEQPTDTSKETADLAKRAEQASKQKPKAPMDDTMRKASSPSVLLPDETVRKPVPNPSTTSSQWYDQKK